jgi:hypothetical protein
MMPSRALLLPVVVTLAAGCGSVPLRAERSRALFREVARSFMHPRCLNCHPSGDTPTQGDAMLVHDPPIARGPNDDGVDALHCTSCHQETNLPLARVPGAPRWRLAPKTMAWAGRSAHAICAQLKDPARNGGRTLSEIATHVAHDPLVGWAWSPGGGRTPVPRDQASLGEAIAAWIESGAECPEEEGR